MLGDPMVTGRGKGTHLAAELGCPGGEQLCLHLPRGMVPADAGQYLAPGEQQGDFGSAVWSAVPEGLQSRGPERTASWSDGTKFIIAVLLSYYCCLIQGTSLHLSESYFSGL